MIIASIDIGTNTVLLLIADVNERTGKINSILNEFRIPRIGKGLIPDGSISNEKINELFKILDGYFNIINKLNCKYTLITATNAFRIASNGKEIAERITKHFNMKVNIISGDEEARLSFLGALSDKNRNGDLLVIDIGGGSTELIFGTINEIIFKKSFPVGVVSGAENYLLHDPPVHEEIERFIIFVNGIFNGLKYNIKSPDISIAIAGTPTTLACIQNKLMDFDEEKIENSKLKRTDIKYLFDKLRILSANEILNTYKSIVNGRQDVLISGSIILFQIMEILNLDEVIVSTKGIRYGAIVEYINTNFKNL